MSRSTDQHARAQNSSDPTTRSACGAGGGLLRTKRRPATFPVLIQPTRLLRSIWYATAAAHSSAGGLRLEAGRNAASLRPFLLSVASAVPQVTLLLATVADTSQVEGLAMPTVGRLPALDWEANEDRPAYAAPKNSRRAETIAGFEAYLRAQHHRCSEEYVPLASSHRTP